MRVISWNMRKATETSIAWEILNDLNPDVALLQEVASIPNSIKESFKGGIKFQKAVGKTGKPQQFGTAIFVKGTIVSELPLSSEYDWLNRELKHFAGNIVACVVQPKGYSKLKTISVYSPAWPVDPARLKGIDFTPISGVLPEPRPAVWLIELVLAALQNIKLRRSERWLVGGDFNTSETFDFTWGSGNREILDGMSNLGFTECLRAHNHKLTPTFRNPKGGKIIHQIDHLFVADALFSKIQNCTTGDEATIFGKSVSDHLPIIADFENLQSVPSYIEKLITKNRWVFAKTMAEIPHYYIVRDNLSENDKKRFDEFDVFIKKNGYTEKFYSKQYTYYNIRNYKYWVIENILNRALLELKQ